ncbi:hypothetical protein [Winogradskyella pulchriflava]|uniref:Uncharacterized protein n=1 Tax=Winogradskyella pulchriflava TaxID=1110688 RepID=A0ABV6QA69_9FLAO
MKIKSNALPIELSSPFYDKNKTFCSTFEHYIASKNGKVKGIYNAYSYLVYGKIINPKPWNLIYKKSTFTSTGNLLLSSESQSLLVLAEWKTELKGTYTSEVKIRKRKRLDSFILHFNKSLSILDITDKYIIYSKGESIRVLKSIIEILKPLFVSGEIYKVELINEKLNIELRSKQHHFDILDKLLVL